jgi:hypothetical protein
MRLRYVKGTTKVSRFSIPIEVANYGDLAKVMEGTLDTTRVRRASIAGVVDSGAARLVLPAKLVKELGLPAGKKVKVRYADGRTAERNTAIGVQVSIHGRSGTFTAVVEPKRQTALVGAIVLEDLDLLVDCTHERVVPRDPRMVVSEIE